MADKWTLSIWHAGNWRHFKYTSGKLAMDKAFNARRKFCLIEHGCSTWSVIVLDPNGARYLSDHN